MNQAEYVKRVEDVVMDLIITKTTQNFDTPKKKGLKIHYLYHNGYRVDDKDGHTLYKGIGLFAYLIYLGNND